MMPRAIDDQDGPLPGEATPNDRRDWIARIAAIADSIGIPLDPDAIDPETTLDIGTIPVADAFRLALDGRATHLDSFAQAGARRWRIEIIDADGGEPVLATVLT